VTEEMAALLALEHGSAKFLEAAYAQKPAGSGVALETLQPTELVPQAIARVPASPPPLPSRRRDELASLFIATWKQGVARLVNSKTAALRFWSTTGRQNRRYFVATLAAIGIVALLTLASQFATGSAPRAVTTPPVPNSPQRSLAKEPAPQVVATAESTDSGDPLGCERWLNAAKPLRGSSPGSERNPGQAKHEWYGARKAIHLGDWDKAEERLCRSAALDPMGPGAAGLADLFLSRGKLQEADGWGTWALSLQPKDRRVKQMLADVRSQQGRTDEARALLLESMNVSDGDQQVLKQVAKNYTDLGYRALRARDPYQARRLFWRARVLDGNNALACVGLAKLELKDGDPKQAAKWALEATKLDPNYFHAHLALGDAREKSDEPSLAKQAWLDAARLQPQSPEVRKRLGI
jgi:Tfp pilus assembly protein PilF